jgi:hypothetical protein
MCYIEILKPCSNFSVDFYAMVYCLNPRSPTLRRGTCDEGGCYIDRWIGVWRYLGYSVPELTKIIVERSAS